jgi:hypothetical protein
MSWKDSEHADRGGANLPPVGVNLLLVGANLLRVGANLILVGASLLLVGAGAGRCIAARATLCVIGFARAVQAVLAGIA